MPNIEYRGHTTLATPCGRCGEDLSNPLHTEYGDHNTRDEVDCNYDVDYIGDPLKPVITCDCHEYERSCYCADSGRCEICVEKAVDFADSLRDSYKEAEITWRELG